MIHKRLLGCTALFLLAVCAAGCAQKADSDSDSGSESSFDIDDFIPEAQSEPSEAVTVSADRIEFCGTSDPDEESMRTLSSSFSDFISSGRLSRTKQALYSSSPIDIPVVFHVISKGPTFEEGEVPDSLLYKQIDVMNSAYSGAAGGIETPFRFRLAAIDRVRKPEWFTMSPGSDSEMRAKEALKQGGSETLNIYLADIEAEQEVAGGRGKILGYTTLPLFYFIMAQYDGIVLNFAAIADGPLDHYNYGNVGVHETGHWFGLLHTFTSTCDSFFDDLISDTPRELVPEKGQYCPTGRDSCPEQTGLDPIHNHMTYTADECRSEFTEGQLDFMLFNASIFRGLQV